jgi:hypothetical protein
MRLPLPKDPAKRKQLLLALAAGGAILAAYVYLQRGSAGSSVPADQIAPDPGAVGTGDLLPATSGLPSSDAVSLSSVQAAIAQARALLTGIGLVVSRPKQKPPKHHPKHNPPKTQKKQHKKKLHPARKGAWTGNPVTPPKRRQPLPITVGPRRAARRHSAIAQASTQVAPSPYRVQSRLHLGAT